MKERPILFSTPMVRAIMAGRKTQTRRVVKDQNIRIHPTEGWPGTSKGELKCPYGQPGDMLWVRETWAPIMDTGGKNPLPGAYCYKQEVPSELVDWKWRPSIHMPKAAARIWLEITNVRVERLHDISEADARAEGIAEFTKDGKVLKYGLDGWEWSLMPRTARAAFSMLWAMINGQKSWDSNPWVWVVEFKVISTTGGKPCPR